MGGCKNNTPTGAIDEFDTITQTWSTSEAKFRARRVKLAATADGENAYAFGGWDPASGEIGGCVVLDWANRYCTKTRTVENLAKMNAERLGGAAVFKHDDEIIFVAGEERWWSSVPVDKYDVASNTWSTIATLKGTENYITAAAILSDDLYLVGGSTAGVNILDTCTGRLRVAPKLVHARGGCSAAAFDRNVICVLGGNEWRKGTAFSSVEALDVREGKWTVGNIVPDMPKTNASFGFARVLL